MSDYFFGAWSMTGVALLLVMAVGLMRDSEDQLPTVAILLLVCTWATAIATLVTS